MLERPTSGRIAEDGTHHLPVRVYYEDTDAAGIVYYANYLKFIERARSDMMRLIGVTHSALADRSGLAFVVRRCAVTYRKPARLDDELDVRTRIRRVRGALLEAWQSVYRGDERLVESDLRIACIDAAGSIQVMPDPVRRALAALAPHS